MRISALAGLLLATFAYAAYAQAPADYPAKPIHILVGFTAEGFDKLIRDDVVTFTKIAREPNIKAE